MIRVCDAIMSSGKSSACINYMNEHPEKKYIYITPYLDEAERIRDGCPRLRFVEPIKGLPEFGYTKVGHTAELIRNGRNITTTHQAFKFYTEETLRLIKEHGYTLFIDENIDILMDVDTNQKDLDVLVDAGYLIEDVDRYTRTDKEYGGTMFCEIFRLLQSRDLIKITETNNNHLVYWALPAKLVTAFEDVFVLTYMFEGQDIKHFFDLHNLEYSYIYITKSDKGYEFSDILDYVPSYVSELFKHIHICDHKKLNDIGARTTDLSMGWYQKHPARVDQLRKNIFNYFTNLIPCKASDRLWATFNGYRTKLRGKGYSNSFLTFNKRATNDFAHCNVLVYAVNIYMNVGQKIFYTSRGITVDEDMYALSTMVQWIFRSAIRNGEDIYIYIPSKRMRTLLIKWMYGLAGIEINDEDVDIFEEV